MCPSIMSDPCGSLKLLSTFWSTADAKGHGSSLPLAASLCWHATSHADLAAGCRFGKLGHWGGAYVNQCRGADGAALPELAMCDLIAVSQLTPGEQAPGLLVGCEAGQPSPKKCWR